MNENIQARDINEVLNWEEENLLTIRHISLNTLMFTYGQTVN